MQIKFGLSSRTLLGKLHLVEMPEIALLELRHVAKHLQVRIGFVVVLELYGRKLDGAQEISDL